MRTLILLSLLCIGYAADEPSKLPSDAQTAVDKAEADIVKVRQALIVTLGKCRAAAMKKDDLPGALAIKSKIDEETALVPKPADLLGDKSKDIDPVGKWTVYGTAWTVGTITINKDKTCTGGNGDKGAWSLQKGILSIQWYNGNINKGPLAKDILMEGDKGASFSMKISE